MKTATVAIVGGETLLGRELDERLKEAKLPAQVHLLGAGEETGVLTEIEGEPTVLTPLDADRLHDADVVFCTGDAASARRTHEMAHATDAAIVDLTSALEELPNARVRSPMVNPDEEGPSAGTVTVIAHPAATALAAILRRLHRTHPIRHSVVQVYEPTSERGRAGITELQTQIASLLSFRPLDKRVFDAQIGFNMLARYGEEAPERLEEIESRIVRHLASLLQGAVPIPSLRLIQTPVFHGHSFSLWVEFESRPSVTDVAEALASADIEVRGSDVEPPTNVGVAGQSGVTVGLIEPDTNHPRGMWMWAVADNFRLASDAAVAIAKGILGSSGR